MRILENEYGEQRFDATFSSHPGHVTNMNGYKDFCINLAIKNGLAFALPMVLALGRGNRGSREDVVAAVVDRAKAIVEYSMYNIVNAENATFYAGLVEPGEEIVGSIVSGSRAGVGSGGTARRPRAVVAATAVRMT